MKDAGMFAGVLLAAFLIARFEESGTTATGPQDVLGSSPQAQSAPAYPARTLIDTDAATGGIKGGVTYAAFNAERDRKNIESFHGFGCLGSCDGHEAGYAWAEDNGVSDTADCGGNSWAFEEGCAAYAIENPDDSDEPSGDPDT